MSDIKNEELLDELVVLTRRMTELYENDVISIGGSNKSVHLRSASAYNRFFGKSSPRTVHNIGEYDEYSTIHKGVLFFYLEKAEVDEDEMV